MQFLEHIVGSDGFNMDPTNIMVFRELPKPKIHTEIISFLGLFGYYRRFAKDLSKVVGPLTKLTRRIVPFF